MAQRNVIAAFVSREDAHLAVREMLRANCGATSVRIVPPVSAVSPAYAGQIVVSALVHPGRADLAEDIFEDYGSVDLAEHRRFAWRDGDGSVPLAGGGIARLAAALAIVGGLALMASRRTGRKRLPGHSGLSPHWRDGQNDIAPETEFMAGPATAFDDVDLDSGAAVATPVASSAGPSTSSPGAAPGARHPAHSRAGERIVGYAGETG